MDDKAKIKEYIQKYPKCLDERNDSQDTVLHVAVQNRNNEVLKRLRIIVRYLYEVRGDTSSRIHEDLASLLGFECAIRD